MGIRTHYNTFFTLPLILNKLGLVTKGWDINLRKGLSRIGLDHVKQGYFRSLTFDYLLDDCKQVS